MLRGGRDMLRDVPYAKENAKSAARAALAAFSKRRKRRQRTAPTLGPAAAGTKGRLYPPVFDDFEFFALKKAHSASCNMAADFWPFFF